MAHMSETKERRKWWLGISDGNYPHVSSERKWATDYRISEIFPGDVVLSKEDAQILRGLLESAKSIWAEDPREEIEAALTLLDRSGK